MAALLSPFVGRLVEQVRLRTLTAIPCDVGRLGPLHAIALEQIFRPARCGDEWQQVAQRLAGLEITDQAQGVNPGDRRAIYHLVRWLGPSSVLEVGTHIGASTAHITLALAGAVTRRPVRLTTVDVCDVNHPRGPWYEAGCRRPPRALVAELGGADFVAFVTARSTDFLGQTRDTFDFIFLDGDHTAATVYCELSRALGRLNPGGYVLLHDYFPGDRPLWKSEGTLPGPHLAVKRLQQEGVALAVLPLGLLPWPTKDGSSATSLALVGRT